MVNAVNTVKSAATIIAKTSAAMLADKLQFIKTIDKETGFPGDVNGFDKGDTLTISKPARFIPTTVADLTSNLQDVVEEKTTIALSNQTNVGVNFTSKEIATDLDLKKWMKRIAEPAMSSIAQTIESTALLSMTNAVYNQTGTQGSTVFDTNQMLSARTILKKNLVPYDDKLFTLFESNAMQSAVNARKGLFQKSDAIAKQYQAGYMGTADGFNYLENNLVAVHTRGTQAATGATVTTTLSGEGVATMNVTGTSGGTLLVGDTFTIASVFMVHPITKVVTNTLQPFVVTANNTAVSTAYTGVTFAPAIFTSASNGRQNVNSFPQGSAAIVFTGAASSSAFQELSYHPSAFRFASVPLMLPSGADMAAQETVNGITVRVWQDSIILTDKKVMRFDVLWGITAVRPEWANRTTA